MDCQPTLGGRDERIGTRFAAYRINSVLGEGGVAIVYDATVCEDFRLPLGKRVALKILKPDFATNETSNSRFRREAMIALTVRHPPVVPVLDYGEHDGLAYVAARFIDGCSLEELIMRNGPLDVPTTVKICAEVADGLDALAAAGVVHRDVKPANILCDRGGTPTLPTPGSPRTRARAS